MAFSNAARDRLYDLLPAFIRERDAAERRAAARAALDVVDLQADVIEGDIRQLYENAFIETCEPWVVPYIGDLVGTIAAVRREPRQGRRHGGRAFPRSLNRPTACRPLTRRLRLRPAPTSPRPSTTAAARARCPCWRSWRAT